MENKIDDYKYIQIDGIYRKYTNKKECAQEDIKQNNDFIKQNNDFIKPLFSCALTSCKTCNHKHCLEF